VICKNGAGDPPNANPLEAAAMAEAVGISPSSVGRIWSEAGLKPHLTRGFKVSNDPMSRRKSPDMSGLYLDPRSGGGLLCVDEKFANSSTCIEPSRDWPLKGPRATMTHVKAPRYDHAVCRRRSNVKSGQMVHRRNACRAPAKDFPALFAPQLTVPSSSRATVHLVLDN